MIIGIVSPSLRSATGNASTVRRIQKHLNSAGIRCLLLDMHTMCRAGGVCVRKFMNRFVAENEIDGIIILHAFKSADAVLCKCSDTGQCQELKVPFCVIFGGTDLNEDMHDDEKCAIMQRTINASNFAIAFTQDMKRRAEKISSSTPIFVHPQAVETPKSMDVIPYCSLTNMYHMMKPMLFLLVTSIRPVKDPLFILDKFLELSMAHPDSGLKLMILGPILDETYSSTFFNHIEHLQKKYGDYFTPTPSSFENPSDKVHAWMNDRKSFPILYSSPLPNDSYDEFLCTKVFASVNSSKSEGMSSAILESMMVGVPVIAREIPGNCAVINESETGLLFDTESKFLEQAKRLMFEPSLRTSIIKNALNYVSIHHSPEVEKQFYVNMCLQYFH